MCKHLVIRPEVFDEIEEAKAWYEKRDPELPNRLLNAVKAAFRAIRQAPKQGHRFDTNRQFRYRRVSPFPYLVIYRELKNSIEVLAFAHTAREPEYWKNRGTANGD